MQSRQVLLYIESFLFVIVLSGVFLSPLFVNGNFYNAIRISKNFYFVQWLWLVIPFGLFTYVKYWKQSIGNLSFLMLFWLAWIIIRGKFGGIWNDEKFFWFVGCFAFFFIATKVISKFIKENQISFLQFIYLTITLVAATEATMGLLQLYGGFRVFNTTHNVSGTFFNPAPYAGFLLASLPFALYLTTIKRQNLFNHICYWIGNLTAILIIIVIPATKSRAAYLGLFVAILIWVFYRYKPVIYIKRILNTKRKRLLAFTIIPLVLSVLLVGLYFFKKDSANGRILIWKIAAQSVIEKPITGHGFNTTLATIASSQVDYFMSGKGTEDEEMLAGSIRWAFNEPLQIASEMGIIGLLLFIAIIGYALFYPLPNATISRKHLLNVGTARSSLFGILVFGCFSYPFYSLPITVLFFFSLAILASFKYNYIKKSNIFFKSAFNTIIVIGLIFLGTFYIHTTSKLKQAYRYWNSASNLYQMKVYDKANNTFSKAKPMLEHNGLFLQEYAKSLSMDGEYKEAIQLLLIAENYYKDEFSYIALGDNYKENEEYQKAEEQYILAANMVPLKFYPLYLLAKLYEETGQKEKAITMAKKILDKKVKIESTAIEEIKEEMKKIIEN